MTNAIRKGPEGKTASQRLREALAEMAANATPGTQTAAALCARAGLSRNALYRYHPDILQELHAMKQRASSGASLNSRELLRLRQEASDLRLQTTKLAALVDHYFAAWQETCSLLQRRERELADVRRNAQPRVVRVKG